MTTEISEIWNRPFPQQQTEAEKPRLSSSSPPRPVIAAVHDVRHSHSPKPSSNFSASSSSPSQQPPLDLSGSPRSSISSSISATSSASPSHPAVSLPPGLYLDGKPSRPGLTTSTSFGIYSSEANNGSAGNGGGVFSGLAFLAGREKDFGVTSFGNTTSNVATPTPTSLPTSRSLSLKSTDNSSGPDPEHTQNALAEIFAGNPRPHLRSSVSSTQSPLSPSSTSLASPRAELSDSTSSRSYFSAPPPNRTRSHSSASVLDPHHQPFLPTGMTSPASSTGGPGFGIYNRSPSQQPGADLHGFRPSSSIPNHYSSSMPASVPKPIRIGASPREEGSPQGRMSNFGSYGGGGGGFGAGGSGYDQTGWRSTAQPKQSSFGGWEDLDREGRSRLRSEEDKPWAERDHSVSSTGTGIGLSNMSPFTRDAGRALADLADGNFRNSRREYGLGAVGSGRKRGESVWGSSRPLREAEDEDADDAFAPPTKSGATSRRHSFAAFNPPSRSQIGFSLPEDKPSTSNGDHSLKNSTSTSFGKGSSAINDDDLAADLNSLHLNLEAHVAATSEAALISPTPVPDYRRSTSPPTIPLGSTYLQNGGGASRFFQPPPQAQAGARTSSRFEFGGIGSPTDFGGSNNGGGGMGYGGSPRGGGGMSFGLPNPSPPNPSFYSTPLGSHGLSAQAPPFQGQGFSGKPPTSSQFVAPGPPQPETSNLGRGIPLHSVPSNAPLYIVEFKAGRKDLFFVEDPNIQLRQGDLVIVEADRGKDIGKFYKPCSLDEVQAFQQRLVEMALGQLAHPTGGAPPNPAAIQRMTKEFSPKKIFGKAQPVDTQLLLSKAQDEVKALALVRSKVAQKALSMEVLDAEWQFDRRKLTFYYIATERVDFRELVRELFRLYKTRIWMCCLEGRVQLE